MINRMEATLFERRLAETVAWCSLQCLEEQPAESEEFGSRIALRRKAISLLERATMAEKRGKLQRLLDRLRLARTENPGELKWEARLLFNQSAVSSIYPLNGYDSLKIANGVRPRRPLC
jgi:hypothetical protein